MSFMQRIIDKLDAELWHFVRVIHSANHDYPYHDFVKIVNESSQDALVGSYNVGQANLNKQGDQHKLFVSKITNIFAGSSGTTIKLNDSKNVAIDLPIIIAETATSPRVYGKEFHTNISVVYYSISPGDVLYMHFEGVLPQEARDAE